MLVKHSLATLTLYVVAISTCLAEDTSDWKHDVEVGLNGSSGNSDSLSLHAGYNASYKDADHGWKLATAYDKAKSDGVESRNQFFANLQRDWLMHDSPWFAYAQGRYDWDKFKDWDYRLSASGGAGYVFLDSDNWRLAGRLGVGGNKTYGGTEETFTPEALVAFDAAWNISEREAVDFNTTFYPNLNKSGEYRNLTNFDWKMQINDKGTLAMKIGLSNEYDSLAPEGTDKNDFKYNLSLVWGL